MEKKRISVIIDGNAYNVISDDDEMHVLTVAEMVDRQIREIKKKTNSLNPSMVSVLSAMNIADEFIKFKDVINDSKSVQTRNSALELMEKQIKNLRNELQNSKGDLEKSSEKVFFLQRKLTDKEEEIQNLKNEQQNYLESNNSELENSVKVLEDECNKNGAIIDEANEKISYLKGELSDKEDELQNLINEQQNLLKDNDSVLDNRLKALEEETDMKQTTIDDANEKILYLQRKLDDKEENLQSLRNEQQNFFETNNSELENNLKAVENENNVNQVLIGEANEKVFYLQRKLTDKEEELQNVKKEFEQFLEEFEK
ncbi:MAG: hypothetical protein U9Q80_08515 [Bacillota bacterium]|nr:hypothetical protein [Bacillota bacterium]